MAMSEHREEMFPKSKISPIYAMYKQGKFVRCDNIRRNIDMLYFIQSNGFEYIDDGDASQIVANFDVVRGYAYEGEHDKAGELLDKMFENLKYVNERLITDIERSRNLWAKRPHTQRASRGCVDYASYSGNEGYDMLGMGMHDLGY